MSQETSGVFSCDASLLIHAAEVARCFEEIFEFYWRHSARESARQR